MNKQFITMRDLGGLGKAVYCRLTQ